MRTSPVCLPRGLALLVFSGLVLAALEQPSLAAGTTASRITGLGDKTCFLRRYDGAHMRAHPDQQIMRVELAPAPTGLIGDGGRIVLTIAIKLRGRRDWRTNGVLCEEAGDSLACRLEDDGGTAILSLNDDGRLMFKPGPDGIGVEGPEGSEMIAKPSSDDRLFYLDPAPRAACLKTP